MPDEKIFDIIIRGGTVVDGSGDDRFQADIGIVDDTIKEIIRSNNFEPSFLNFFEELWHKREDQYSQIRFTKKSELPKVEMSYIGG